MDSTPKQWPHPVDEGHVIIHAFEDEGVDYFQMKDQANSFAHRALCALDVYDKLQMRCDDEYIRLFAKALDKNLSGEGNKINLTEVFKLNTHLQERLAFAVPPQNLIYEFAAVAFFDTNESPYKYDPEYGKEKIIRWKKSKSISDFFFATPLKNLIPLPDLSSFDLETYLKIVEKLSQKHYENLYNNVSSKRLRNASSSAHSSEKSLQQTSQE